MHGFGYVIATILLVWCLAVVALFCGAALRAALRPSSVPPSRQPLIDAIEREAGRRNRFVGRVLGLAFILPTALTAPIRTKTFAEFSRRPSGREWGARIRLWPDDVAMSYCALTYGSVTLVISLAGLAPHWLTLASAAVALAAIVLRQLSYALRSLPERLKRSSLDPRFVFPMVVVLDSIGLLVCVSVVRASSHGVGVDAAAMQAAAADLFALKKLPDIFRQQWAAAAVSLIGLLNYGVGIKSLAGLWRLERSSDDMLAIADDYISLGDLEEAREWLSKDGSVGRRSVLVRAKLDMASGNFARAEERVRRYLDDADRETILLYLMDLYLTLPSSLLSRFAGLDYLHTTGAPDTLVSLFVNLGDRTLDSEATRTAWHERVQRLLPEHSYPLAHAQSLFIVGRRAEARRMVDSALTGTELDEVVRLVRSFQYHLAVADDEQIDAAVEAWYADTFPIVVDLVRRLPSGGRLPALGAILDLAADTDAVASRHGRDAYDLARELAHSDEEFNRLTAMGKISRRFHRTASNETSSGGGNSA
ncbi:hypothetical protein ACFY36_12855 [Actinoplanes sp. NPDC000266]